MLKRRTKVLLWIGGSVFVAALLGFACRYAAMVDQYQEAERHAQLYAVSELSDHLAGMSNTLLKGRYAASPVLLTTISSELWGHSAGAIAAMAQLPLSDVCLEKTETFLSQAGDYAAYIARCAVSADSLNEETRQTLQRLSDTAETLSQEILLLESDLYAGNLSFLTAQKDGISAAVQRLSDVETDFPEDVPGSYDGAMSAHLISRTACMTENAKAADAADAKERAAKALQTEASALQLAGESDGVIPAYVFQDTNGGYTAISRDGGYVISVHRNDSGKEGMISLGEALHTAKAYLETIGYSGLTQVYYQKSGGNAIFRFIWRDEEDVLYYPDLVTVGVSLSDGTVVSLDATDYLMNHHERDWEEPTVGYNAAKDRLAPGLTAAYTGLAVIHSPGKEELLCHEFLCTAENGQRMLIYCDTRDGSQCRLTLIHEDENGVFLT